jgi:hypothetical protein
MNCGDAMNINEMSAATSAHDERVLYEALLKHIARYRLSTFEAMSRLLDREGEGPRHLRRLLQKACDAGEMDTAMLHAGIRYWYLTSTGAERLGIDSSRSGPLSEPAKIRAYALLIFCCLSDVSRHRLLPSEMNGQATSLFRPGMPSSYCFDPSEQGRMTLVRVDAGRNGRWDRIVQSVNQDRTSHIGFPEFRQFIEARRFEITILTVLPTKAERIARALKSESADNQIPVRVLALPALLPLIPIQHSKQFF